MNNKLPIIVGLGETLWDCFPDGAKLGGAPVNFACSSAELAKENALVFIASAVGDDSLGRDAIEAISSHGVDTTHVQIGGRATGKVLIELDDAGVASYQFESNAAWDDLRFASDWMALARQCDAVCFGSLGQRDSRSASAIRDFVRSTAATCFRVFDVNLRPPFVDRETVQKSLEIANVLKLNDDELPQLAEMFDCPGDPLQVLRELARQFDLRCVALTRGPDGALLLRGDDVSDVPGQKVDVVDTVGAGDAFTASLVQGLLANQDTDSLNQQAIQVAAYACTQPGATMSFPKTIRLRSL